MDHGRHVSVVEPSAYATPKCTLQYDASRAACSAAIGISAYLLVVLDFIIALGDIELGARDGLFEVLCGDLDALCGIETTPA
jgi:hypothetical protein